MGTGNIFSEAWQAARGAAAQFGGKASDYFYGKEGTLQSAWDQQTGRSTAADTEKERLRQSIVVPPSALPFVSYDWIKANAHRLVATSGSDKFWVVNKGGRSGWDGLDLADYLRWQDGSDVTVVDALGADLVDVLPDGTEYNEYLERIVYTGKLDRYHELGGKDEDIELS